MSREFVVVVPVKPPARGKSRLVGLDDAARSDLARAFALDTVAACRDSARVAEVLVVTDDAVFASDPLLSGCHTIPDGATANLNAALTQAAAEAHRRWPGLTPVALCADLPALTAPDLDATLAALVPGGPSFVADADGAGTTLYAAPYDQFFPAFGIDSAAAHRADGSLAVQTVGESVRRDVDDVTDLAAAVQLGVGDETSAVLSRLGLDLLAVTDEQQDRAATPEGDGPAELS